jgi:type III restriction enzyme
MRLKEYQVQALETLSSYLDTLSTEHNSRAQELADIEKLPRQTRERVLATLGDPVANAWKIAHDDGVAASPDPWRPLNDGTGRSIPHVCLKLPTGGGKTLLAAHGCERILVSYFKRTTGFVLWIVPSEAIYRQTKTQLADRGHPIRQTLDRASGGRVKILEKLDGFTRQDVEDKLCVLLLMLQSTGRQDKETLKVFRESGQYTTFFPQDDPPARAALLKQIPNLDEIDLVEAAQGGADAAWITQSLGNALRVIRPVIVMDEGHRAYSSTARGTLAGLNPRFLLELSATPDRTQSNILVNISGRALKDEEMIKLPIRLEVEENLSWRDTLRRAVDRLNELENEAKAFRGESNRYIRPIMLVRVDRTGKDQRGGDFVHSEDAFEFLTQNAGLAPDAVRRQTAELKELRDDDLLSEYCPVRAIVTKDALREGWDCPFAYVLAILSRGTANTALTQMIGRVLRQPHASRTDHDMLDQTHVFCADVKVAEAVKHIKNGLEAEGMGDLGGEIIAGKNAKETGEEKTIRLRKKFRGKRVMVPRVLHREGKKAYRELDYEADVLACIDWEALSYRNAKDFDFAGYDAARRAAVNIDLASGADFALGQTSAKYEYVVEDRLDRPALIRRLLDVIPNPWQGARILDEALAVLRKRATEADIIAAKFTLMEHIGLDLREQVDTAAESIFRHKIESGDIVFKLLAAPLDELNFEFLEMFSTHVAFGDGSAPLLTSVGTPLERALYETAFKKDFNEFESDVALYLDGRDAITWWWRIAARKSWALQGWRRNRIYPDFLVKLESDGDVARLLVLETKGKQLEGSDDTGFKKKLFDILEYAYTKGRDAGEIELFADAPDAMRFRIVLQEEAWKNQIEGALA